MTMSIEADTSYFGKFQHASNTTFRIIRREHFQFIGQYQFDNVSDRIVTVKVIIDPPTLLWWNSSWSNFSKKILMFRKIISDTIRTHVDSLMSLSWTWSSALSDPMLLCQRLISWRLILLLDCCMRETFLWLVQMLPRTCDNRSCAWGRSWSSKEDCFKLRLCIVTDRHC